MSTAPTSRRSAAYLLLFLAITFLVGGMILTVLNQFWNELETSQLFVFGTTYWQDFTSWATTIHNWIGLLVLVAILYTGFVATRDPV